VRGNKISCRIQPLRKRKTSGDRQGGHKLRGNLKDFSGWEELRPRQGKKGLAHANGTRVGGSRKLCSWRHGRPRAVGNIDAPADVEMFEKNYFFNRLKTNNKVRRGERKGIKTSRRTT